MNKKISKREEERFFGKSPAPVFDGGENAARGDATADYLMAAAEDFCPDGVGLEELQELDDLGFFELLNDLV